MTEAQAWSFLVSRNQFLDYRTVVAPDFMCDANIASLLAKVTEGDPISDNQAYFRKIIGSKCGDLIIIYNVCEAQANDLSDYMDGILKDSFGREIYLIEGFVFTEVQHPILITNEALKYNHQLLLESFRDFWEWVSPQATIASNAISIKLSQIPLQYKCLGDYRIKSTNPKSLVEKRPYTQSLSLKNEIHFLGFLGNLHIINYQLNQRLSLLNLETGEEEPLGKEGIYRSTSKVAFSLRSELLCTANMDYGSLDRDRIRIFTFKSNEDRGLAEACFRELGRVTATAVSFSHDDSIIAFCEKKFLPILSSPISIKLINVKTGLVEDLSHSSEINCIASSHFDSVFAIGDSQGCLTLWNWKSREYLGSPLRFGRSIIAIAFSPCHKLLFVGDDSGNIYIIRYKDEIKSERLPSKSADALRDRVNALAVSPDGKLVASGDDRGNVRLWDIKKKTLQYDRAGHRGPVLTLAFSPDGRRLASGGKDHSVKIWPIN